MTDLREADADARARALEVGDSFIVQAPAGSGKTELLTQRFLALLVTVQDPESILAITFTRKAAAEMRERILGALRAATETDPDGRRHQPVTLQLARAARAADQARGWGLLRNPGRLRIQTIDSLNYGLARRLPVLSGLGAGLGVEEDARELYRLAAARLLAHLPGGEPAHTAAVGTVLRHLDNRGQRFADLVVEMLGRREAWLPALPAGFADEATEEATREALEAARRSLVSAHLQTLLDRFPAELLRESVGVAKMAAQTLRVAGADSPLLGIERIEEAPTGDPADTAAWRALAELLLTAQGTARKPGGLNKNLGIPAGPAGKLLKARAGAMVAAVAGHPYLCEALHAVRGLPEGAYDASEWEALKALLVVLRLAVAELELIFASSATADYPRFAMAAIESLGSPDEPTDTALALDARLAHVLVDEFQDTSEGQVRLLEALTAGWQSGDGRTLFLVGDPMQSIYRFRNAEVGLFLDVRDHGLGELQLTPLNLHVNFRSTDPVVSWINAAFEQVLPPQDDVLRGAVRYCPSIAATAAGGEGGVRMHALLGRAREEEAERVVEIVYRRLREEQKARVAILVQGRRHLLHIVPALTARGIAFQATDIDPLAERPIVLDLLSLTRALAHLADRVAWLSVLRAPWCGLSLAELHALAGEDHEATLIEQLQNPEVRARIGGESGRRLAKTQAVLEQSLAESRQLGLRDAVERAWLALGGPATATSRGELDEAQAYLDVLASIEQRGPGPADLLLLTRALEKLYAPSRVDAEARVELMTIHKAKGLQFDTVIVPGLERAPARDRHALLHWMKLPETGHDALIVAPVERTGSDPNPLYRWLANIENEKLLQERRRLLYVAATRAERWLHLFGRCDLVEDESGPRLRPPAAGVALGMLWPAVGDSFKQRLAEAGTGDTHGHGREPARDPPLRRLPASWQLPELPPVPLIAAPPRSVAPGIAPLQFDWASESARHTGTVVHRELQRLAEFPEAADPDDPMRRRRYESELAELGVPVDRRADALERVVKALKRSLADPRGRWLLESGHREAQCELALSGLVDGQVVNVIIDRTFVDDQGVRWVVDYKTSSHEGSGLDDFLDREQERYRAQLDRYAILVARLGPEPVQVGLYFPLLSAWREWRP